MMINANYKHSIEIDFTEDIKNMNKIKEPKNTAVSAPVPEIKAQDIVDIPDDQNTESLDGELIQTTLLQMQHQYKILHWQTTSFSQHKAFDEIVSSLSEHIDEFIETYMGKYGRVIAATKFNFSLSNYKDTDYVSLTNNYILFLIGLNDKLDKAQDSDLLNIRDEILGSLNQLKYLLSLS
jgi:DNA-binding ferritin-like protein